LWARAMLNFVLVPERAAAVEPIAASLLAWPRLRLRRELGCPWRAGVEVETI
jgi:hypothetical protein